MASEKVPPLNTRLNEGFMSKTQWLGNYYQFRQHCAYGVDQTEKAKQFLSAIGKNNSDLADKYRGAFLGLAVGDAFGTTLEFSARKSTETHTEMSGGGPFNLKPGQWTDDTSMALCLAESLHERCCFDPSHQMDLYLDWWQNGLYSSTGACFDIGNTVSKALNTYSDTKNPYSGPVDEYSAGNGSLMRLCPVVMFFASNESNAIEKAGDSSKTTHGNQQSVDACRYFAGLLLGAFRGETKKTLLSEMYSPVKGLWELKPLCWQVEAVARGSYKSKGRDDIKSSGYVIDSLEAALWAFESTESFESGLIKAVNLGGDADTVGAIYGQIAGAYYGELGIPFKLIAPLSKFHYFYFFAEEFVCFYKGHKELVEC